jgi:hypothetical protein
LVPGAERTGFGIQFALFGGRKIPERGVLPIPEAVEEDEEAVLLPAQGPAAGWIGRPERRGRTRIPLASNGEFFTPDLTVALDLWHGNLPDQAG